MERILRLIAHVDVDACLTWGGVVWGIVDGIMTLYEGSSITTYYTFDTGKVESQLLGNLQVQEEEKVHLRLEYVAALTLWGLWRSRCKFMFQDIHEHAAVIIKAIWNDLVHTLKGEWSSIQGTSERCRKQRNTVVPIFFHPNME